MGTGDCRRPCGALVYLLLFSCYPASVLPILNATGVYVLLLHVPGDRRALSELVGLLFLLVFELTSSRKWYVRAP